MSEVETRFHEICEEHDKPEEKDFKGSLLLKAFESQRFGEELLASYVTIKQKFGCLNAFIVTKTRIIEINAYSTMYITNSRRYKSIKKVSVEYAFDDREIEKVLNDQINPERIQMRITLIYDNDETEEFVWENIEDKQSIIYAVDFSKQLLKIQAQS